MIEKRPFGTLADGTEVFCWTLTNEAGLQAEVLDYGVTIRTIVVPDQTGKPVDVVLGYDTLEEYVTNDGCFGAIIGRFANRIAGASFELNGKTYTLCANDGTNHIHGGGFAGTVQAFVPFDVLDAFCAGMDSVLGDGACHVLRIRPQGGVEMIP